MKIEKLITTLESLNLERTAVISTNKEVKAAKHDDKLTWSCIDCSDHFDARLDVMKGRNPETIGRCRSCSKKARKTTINPRTLKSYENIKSSLDDLDYQLVTSPQEFKNKTIQVQCAKCNEITNRSKAYLQEAINKGSLKSHDCGNKRRDKTLKKGRKKLKLDAYDRVSMTLESHGICIITSRGRFEGVDETPLEWICRSPDCNNTVSVMKRSLDVRIKNDVDRAFKCDDCRINPLTLQIEEVQARFADAGYVISDPSQYKNATSMMDCTHIETGEECKKSANRLQQGHIKTRQMANKEKTLTRSQIKKRLKKHGLKLKGRYHDRDTPIKFLCHCGNLGERSYISLSRNWIGCMGCVRKKRCIDWATIELFSATRGIAILSEEDAYQNQNSSIDWECLCGQTFTKSWKKLKKSPRCITCSDEIRKETCTERHDSPYAVTAENARDALQEWLDERNITHNSYDPDVIEKRRQTNLTNSGVTCALMLKWIRDLSRAAMIEEYGAPTPGESEICQLRSMMTNMDKYGARTFIISESGQKFMKEKCGELWFIASDMFTDVMVERYDEEYAMHVPEIFDKAMANRGDCKVYTFSDGVEFKCQGYEPGYLRIMESEMGYTSDQIATNSVDMPDIWYENPLREKLSNCHPERGTKTSMYHPDIYIASEDRFIEIKSTHYLFKDGHYEVNIAKWIEVSSNHDLTVVLMSPYSIRLVEFNFFNDESIQIIGGHQYYMENYIKNYDINTECYMIHDLIDPSVYNPYQISAE